jgi:flagellin-specific chaperone FliS
MNDLELQNTEIDNSDLEFVVFSCEPFGFDFPQRSELKKMSNHRLARQFSKSNMAINKFTEILHNISHLQQNEMKSVFMAKLDTIYSELQPWCIKINNIKDLKKILDNYMVGYNVNWDGGRIGNNLPRLYFIQLWIELDCNLLAYKKIYKPH